MNKFANELPLGGLPYTPEGMNTRVASMVSNLLKNYCINATVEPLDDKEIESLVPKFNSKIPSKTAGR